MNLTNDQLAETMTSGTARILADVEHSTEPWSKTFASDDPLDEWGGQEAAKLWLEAHGYSIGRMQREDPMGILKGDFDIAKWRNLSTRERSELDGVLIVGRDGSWKNEAIVILKVAPVLQSAMEPITLADLPRAMSAAHDAAADARRSVEQDAEDASRVERDEADDRRDGMEEDAERFDGLS